MITALLNLAVVVWSVVPLLPDVVAMVGSGVWRPLTELARHNQYALAVATIYAFEMVAALRRKTFSADDVWALGVLHAVLAALTLTGLVLHAYSAMGQGQDLAEFLHQAAYKAAVAASSLTHAARILSGRCQAGI